MVNPIWPLLEYQFFQRVPDSLMVTAAVPPMLLMKRPLEKLSFASTLVRVTAPLVRMFNPSPKFPLNELPWVGTGHCDGHTGGTGCVIQVGSIAIIPLRIDIRQKECSLGDDIDAIQVIAVKANPAEGYPGCSGRGNIIDKQAIPAVIIQIHIRQGNQTFRNNKHTRPAIIPVPDIASIGDGYGGISHGVVDIDPSRV